MANAKWFAGIMFRALIAGVLLGLLFTKVVFADQVDLKWQPSPEGDFSHYTVYRGWHGGAFSQVTTTTLPAFIDSGLADLTTYTYCVTATDDRGNESKQSASVSVMTDDRTAPLNVESMTIKALELNKEDRRVKLKFDVTVGFSEIEE